MQPELVHSTLASLTIEEEKNLKKDVPYRNLLGCLLYIGNCCQPDIAYSVTCLSQICENPGVLHWESSVTVLMYLALLIQRI